MLFCLLLALVRTSTPYTLFQDPHPAMHTTVDKLAAQNNAFRTLHAVTVMEHSREVEWLLEPCNTTASEPSEPCNFFLAHIATLTSIEGNAYCRNRGMSFSLDPWSKRDLWGAYFRKTFTPRSCTRMISESVAGQIMFDVDWTLKGLFHEDNTILRGVEGYRSVDELLRSRGSSSCVGVEEMERRRGDGVDLHVCGTTQDAGDYMPMLLNPLILYDTHLLKPLILYDTPVKPTY
jgi:hypothetical protein